MSISNFSRYFSKHNKRFF